MSQPYHPRLKTTHQCLRAALVALTMGATMAPLPAWAATPGAPLAASYQVAAGPLDEALASFAATAGVSVQMAPAQVAGRSTAGLNGRMSIAEGFAVLLAGSGLEAVDAGGGVWVLLAASSGAGAVTTLAPVTITAQGDRDAATEGTGSYAQSGASTTSTGLALTLRETPQSITVVTRQKMDDFQLETLKDVLNQTPGVSVSTQGDSVRFWARGGEINNYLIDGSRSGQAVASTGVPVGTNLVGDDLAEMDHVEVLKGSAGLLQGDGYPTATVNMIRKKPTRTFHSQVGGGVGSWNSKRGDVDIGGALTDNGHVRGRVVAALSDADSFRDYANNRNALFYAVADADLGRASVLNVGLTYKKLKNTGNSAYQGYQAYGVDGRYYGDVARSWNAAAPWSSYEQEKLTVFGGLEHHFSNDWKATLSFSHDATETPLFEAGGYYHRTLARAVRATGVQAVTNNARIEFSGPVQIGGRQHDLLVGADYSHANYDAQVSNRRLLDYSNVAYTSGGAGLAQPSNDGWERASTVREQTVRRAAYATARLNPVDDVKVIVGARVSDYEYRQSWYALTEKSEKGVVTPFAGLVYDLNRSTSLYASYADVFQPVTVLNEQGKVLDPQQGVTYETGAKAAWLDGRLNIAAALFWKRWQNTYVASGGLTPTGDTAYRNVDGAMERGYELEASGEVASGWQLQASYVQNASSISDTYFPKQQFKLNTSHALSGPWTGLTVGAGARWQSAVSTATYARLEQPAYVVVDAMARYALNRQLTLGVNVNNLLDKKYYAGVNTMGSWGEYYDWGAPRSINVSVRYKF